ncbi:threonine/serine exporter family protein [Riemerella columbina]|uniref:threonine/serine exporter family protein n=1 Tax=Riemerella columbina TaxID=103810 RepID=UPI00266F60D0|nr:threonine/serine exporter family protein [Riemerella columbina]WKS94995.1 threonine/serine exporter family protein [Riemerella columbina]
MEFDILEKIAWAVLVSLGFAILFNTPRRALWAVALLGALGFGIKTIALLFLFPDQLIIASLLGASAVGLSGIYFAHRVHTPPIVFTIPAVINMIPGTLGYNFMMGILELVSHKKNQTLSIEQLLTIINNGLNAGFIILVLAFGVVFPILMFNTQTVKNKDLNQYLKKKIIHFKRRHQS